MSYKHYIITRFMCDNFIKDYRKLDINSQETINKSLDIAKRHIISTLENQTNKNFTLMFLVSDNLSEENIYSILKLSDVLAIEVVRLSDLNYVIESVDTDYLITSRLDYDDHVYNNCVKDIQDLLNKNPEVKLWGVNQGMSLVDGEIIPHLMRREIFEQNKDGFFAPMISLILKKEACKKYFDIYKLGYHIDCIRNFLNVQSHYMKRDDYTLEDIYETTDETELYYIWIRHKDSASAIVWNLIHSTNIRIDITESELNDIFGYKPY